MAFEIRGECQNVRHVDSPDSILHDPLLVTRLDFNRRSLDQLAHALHLTVTHTYQRLPPTSKGSFFRGDDNKPVNPTTNPAGRDVHYLLKNIESNIETYASYLGLEEESLMDTVDFLLKDIRNQMAHQTYLSCTGESSTGCELTKNETTMKCLEECQNLLTWISTARFYHGIAKKVKMILSNIENMIEVFHDFERVMQSLKDRSQIRNYATNTKRAKERLQDLLSALEEEEDLENSIEHRPLTHFVNMVIAPRLRESRD